MKIRTILFMWMAWCSFAGPFAFGYLPYLPNENLKEEIKSQPWRILPRSEYFFTAIDADFFKPMFFAGATQDYVYDTYHGNGYWVISRTEVRPLDALRFNLRLNIYQGTSSVGPAAYAAVFPMVGLTYEQDFLGLKWKARLGDLNRVTLGNGLFYELRETQGGSLEFEKNDLFLKALVDGTSGFRVDGGVVALEGGTRSRSLGFTAIFNETNVIFRPPSVVGTLYGNLPEIFGVKSGGELGFQSFATAAMLYLETEKEIFGIRSIIKPQYRYYGSRILGSLPRRIHQTYISYDQNDKPFTMPINIFAIADHAHVWSLLWNLEYRANAFYTLFSENEYVAIQPKYFSNRSDLFFRAGVRFYPFSGRDDHFSFLVGNKFLRASKSDGSGDREYSLPTDWDLENKTLFFKQAFVMANFLVRF